MVVWIYILAVIMWGDAAFGKKLSESPGLAVEFEGNRIEDKPMGHFNVRPFVILNLYGMMGRQQKT